jgi:hypothetical protein
MLPHAISCQAKKEKKKRSEQVIEVLLVELKIENTFPFVFAIFS